MGELRIVSVNRIKWSFYTLFAICSLLTPLAAQESDREKHIRENLERLKDKEWTVRSKAVKELADLGAKDYTKNIAELLKDDSTNVRYHVVWSLGRLNAKEYAKEVAELLKDKSVRSAAVITLRNLDAKEYTNEITELLRDKDIRRKAVNALNKLGWPAGARKYTKDIVQMLEDKDEEARFDAVLALGRLNATEYVKDIAELLKDEVGWIRAAAVWALVKLGKTEGCIVEKELKEAIASFDVLIKMSPEIDDLYIERADIKSYLCDYKGAIEDWEKAIELNPLLKPELQPSIDEAKKKLESKEQNAK
ncbi:HEAT repeat domain-containing protein [Candidatus Peregrinibacteria bacterium]|nr:HEAT repeat domain-containing protein [Candidatus Peregrinibacteria bacterium]